MPNPLKSEYWKLGFLPHAARFHFRLLKGRADTVACVRAPIDASLVLGWDGSRAPGHPGCAEDALCTHPTLSSLPPVRMGALAQVPRHNPTSVHMGHVSRAYALPQEADCAVRPQGRDSKGRHSTWCSTGTWLKCWYRASKYTSFSLSLLSVSSKCAISIFPIRIYIVR